MEQFLAGQGLCFTYHREPDALQRIAHAGLENLLVGGAPYWPPGDHLIIAAFPNAPHILGMLSASQHASVREPFLLLEAAYVAPQTGGATLLQRMLALLLLRLARDDALPPVIAARTSNAACRKCLREFAARCGDAIVFPPEGGNVIDFAMAALDHRVRAALPAARDLLVLEFGAIDEAVLLEYARRLYRRRGTKRPVPGFDSSREPSQINAPRRKVAATRPAILRP